MTGDALTKEIERATAVSSVASQIIQNGSLVLKAMKFADDKWDADSKVPKMLSGGKE